MTSCSTFNCFGVPIEGTGLEATVQQAFTSPKLFWIVTANPEILLHARRNKDYHHAISSADLRIVDGFGLLIAARLTGHPVQRVTGVDLSQALIDYASEHQRKVAFIGGFDSSAQEALEYQLKQHPLLQIQAFAGGMVDIQGIGDDTNDEARHQVSLFGPDVLLVALGGGLKQELWIQRYLNEFPTVRVVAGVGGTIDYWAGRVPTAPAWMRAMGLEWLYRLICEPKRWKRIWNAVVVFPVLWVVNATMGV